jgi:hypothetical protein
MLVWIWGHVFGTGEAGLRSLSALAGVATVPVTWSAARRLIGPLAGLLAAALVAVIPTLVWYSQEARAYAPLVFLSAVSFLFFVRLRQDPTRRNAAGWAVASSLALLTHYFAVFIVAVEFVWLLGTMPSARRLVVAAALPVVVVGLALVPLAYHQEKDGRTSWIAGEPLGRRLGQVFHELGTASVGQINASTGAPHGGLGPIALGLVLIALVLACVATTRRERIGAAVALGVGAASIVIPLILALAGADFFLDRNLAGAWIPLVIVPAAGLAARRTLLAGLAVAAAVGALAVAVDVQVTRDPDLQRQNWRALVHDLGPPGQTRAIVAAPAYFITPLQVYGQRLSPARPGARVAELILLGSIPTSTTLPSGLAALRPVQVVTFNQGLALERFRGPGLVTLTAADLGALPGRVLTQAGPKLARWLGGAIRQIRRWQELARVLARHLTAVLPPRLLAPAAEPGLLLHPPPDLANRIQVRRSMRQVLRAASGLAAPTNDRAQTARRFRAALAGLLAAVKK